MPYRRPRMYKKHSGTDILHNVPDFILVIRRITMNLTFSAACLAVSFRTTVKPLMGIFEKCGAIFT